MEYPLPTPDALRPWLTATLVATLIAVVELVVIVGAGLAVFGKSVAKHVERAAVRHVYAPVKTTGTPLNAPGGRATLTRHQTVVTVLNGTGVGGAAAARAQAVRSHGYMVGQVGNSPHRAARTVVEYRAGYRAEAARLARDLHVKVITPLDGLRVSDLLGAHLALVLGT